MHKEIALQNALMYIQLCSAQSTHVFWTWKFPSWRRIFWDNFPTRRIYSDSLKFRVSSCPLWAPLPWTLVAVNYNLTKSYRQTKTERTYHS